MALLVQLRGLQKKIVIMPRSGRPRAVCLSRFDSKAARRAWIPATIPRDKQLKRWFSTEAGEVGYGERTLSEGRKSLIGCQ